MPVRVVVIEDLLEVREGLAMLISGTSGFECTGRFRTMEEALAGVEASRTAAREMGISTHIVSFHLKHIDQKLQVHSKSEAVAKALRERLIESLRATWHYVIA